MNLMKWITMDNMTDLWKVLKGFKNELSFIIVLYSGKFSFYKDLLIYSSTSFIDILTFDLCS